jgi:hypothetical protein
VQLNNENSALRHPSNLADAANPTYTGTSPYVGEDGNVVRPTYTGRATSYLSTAHSQIQSLHGATYEVYLPIDYLHMLNCVCVY